MYARVALFEDHDPEQMDELVRRLEERSQNPEQLPHAKAFLALVDRESGKSVGITFFESEEALEASERALEQFPSAYPDSLKGRRVSVGRYEVGVADRPEAIGTD